MAITITVEDGTLVEDANSYVEVTEVDQFCENLGLTTWASLSTTQRQTAILRAMPWIESQEFKGVKYNGTDQALKWPRDGVYDEDGFAIEDYVIPQALKDALSRAAYEESVSPGVLLPTRTSGVKREKVDVLEIEYFGESGGSEKVFDAINAYLRGLLVEEGFVEVIRT